MFVFGIGFTPFVNIGRKKCEHKKNISVVKIDYVCAYIKELKDDIIHFEIGEELKQLV